MIEMKPKKRTIDVFIFDPYDFMREKIAGAISRLDDVRVVAQSGDESSFPQSALDVYYDYIFIEFTNYRFLKEKLRAIKEKHPNTLICLYSSCCSKSDVLAYAKCTLEAGADLFLEAEHIADLVAEGQQRHGLYKHTGY